ncbi:MAG: hypothetical protein V4685_12530, partial [Bacteroidota bacterium]
LEKSLKLNLHCLEMIQAQKVKSKLVPIYRNRVIEIILHSIAALLLLAFLFKNFSLFPYAASAVLLLSFYVTAIVMCLKQIAIIKRMDYSNDVVTIQSSLVMLQTHIVTYMRLAVLFIPAFLAFPGVMSKVIIDFNITSLSFMDLLSQYKGNWWNTQLTITIILIPLCAWFYREVNYKNIHKQWVKQTIDGTSGKRVRQAMEFIRELEDLKQG